MLVKLLKDGGMQLRRTIAIIGGEAPAHAASLDDRSEGASIRRNQHNKGQH